MAAYKDLSVEELTSLKADLEQRYAECKARGLSLNMARGKPSPAQLDLSMPMLDTVNSASVMKAEGGDDCRNYGVLEGLPEARKLMGDICGAAPENVLVFGNSSLNIMFDVVSHAWTHGVCGEEPWCYLDSVKFLCPVPGYDRHFGICEHFGIEMIPVPMNEDGPDMDLVEELVSNDDAIKGIWCVPKYANPTGISYSDEVVSRFAALKPAAEDFRIFWDNAYVVHHLYEEHVELLDILQASEAAGNLDRVYMFCSTSKITFGGAGLAAFAASAKNVEDIKVRMNFQTIGHDKINQLRHVRFLKDIDGVRQHMEKHAAIIRPKFEAVLDTLESELAEAKVGSWTKPRGGYFISFDALPGCAKAIVTKAKEAGVVMTGAGATYPYKNDPQDSNIRIAPTFPSPEELTQASEVFVLCVKLVSIDKILAERTS
ncbi:MAG: aminotransferase class I/II-fold pyridoxal phosphate-dependent enzyme [Actinobacteria bacterium]|nr:aminotransferase class I/II-fold pyridoxal phosphate-dependent enzyme [Actinomycetota bacterium]